MSSKNLSKQLNLLLILIGLTLSAVVLFNFIPESSRENGSALIVKDIVSSPIQEKIALPVHFQILAIGVSSAIEEVGLTSDGAMDVPKNISNVGWFNLGPRPGEIGMAVIDGHYGISKGKASAFDGLYKLRKGDKIDITDESGKIISFIVTGNRRYDPKADAKSVFSSSDGKSHLSLVTCEGVWDEVSESYPTRLVVFADKE